MPATPYRIIYDGDRYQYTIERAGLVVRRFRKGTTHRHVERVLGGMLDKFFLKSQVDTCDAAV